MDKEIRLREEEKMLSTGITVTTRLLRKAFGICKDTALSDMRELTFRLSMTSQKGCKGGYWLTERPDMRIPVKEFAAYREDLRQVEHFLSAKTQAFLNKFDAETETWNKNRRK